MPTQRKNSRNTRRRKTPELLFGDLWEFDPAPESADPKLKESYSLYIDGQQSAPKSRKYFESINPGTEKALTRIPAAGKADVNDAFSAATNGLNKYWSKLSGKDRGK